jgi:hypothetical protein
MDPNENEEVLPDIVGPSPEGETAEDATEETLPTPESAPEQDFENIDPTKLSPELQKIYKGFQGSYTKKMQGMQKTLEGLQAHAERLQLMDRAMAGDPAARQTLAKALQLEAQKADHPQDDIPAQFTDSKHLVSTIEGRIMKQVAQAIQQNMQSMAGNYLQPIQAQMQYQQQMAEYESVKKVYPDFDAHIPAMIEVRQQYPGIPLEAAYKLVTYKSPAPRTQVTAKPGVRPSATKPKPSGQNMTFDEAAAAAVEELKGKRR